MHGIAGRSAREALLIAARAGSDSFGRLATDDEDHYAVLGLERGCSYDDIRKAYRILAKRYHPDVSRNSGHAQSRIKALNAAYEVLGDPVSRRDYDRDVDNASRANAASRGAKIERNVSQEVRLRVEDLLKGTSVEVQVRDPANPNGTEVYGLRIPAGTAPGARFRIARARPMEGGFVDIKVKVQPGYRFAARGSDLRSDLRIDNRRAANGGTETVEGPTGKMLRVNIPPNVKRGEVLRIAGEGLPKLRGGRGDLLLRVTYRPEVRVTRNR